uniref:Uncharacterized protein n=1 Tax=Salmo trutta TaxID=8032 RepID=A0A673X759_SALTR
RRHCSCESFSKTLRALHTWIVLCVCVCVCVCVCPDMAEQRYCVENAKRDTTGFAGEMEWYQVKCVFEKLEQAWAITKKIEDTTDLGGWEELLDEAKVLINKLVGDLMAKANTSPKKKVQSGSVSSPGPCPAKPNHVNPLSAQLCDPKHKDSLLQEFRKLCAMVADKNSYNVKTQISHDFLKKNTPLG